MNILHQKIDLLPPWARKAKTLRLLIKILPIIQLSVFLLLFGLVTMLNAWERGIQSRSQALRNRIFLMSEYSYAPQKVSAELQAALADAQYIEAFFLEMFPEDFNPQWLDHVLETIPQDVIISNLSYDGQELIITAATPNIYAIQEHILSLSEFFENVRLSQLARNQGNYSYELRIR